MKSLLLFLTVLMIEITFFVVVDSTKLKEKVHEDEDFYFYGQEIKNNANTQIHKIVLVDDKSSAVEKVRQIENNKISAEKETLEYRLPKNIIPEHYTIKLSPHIFPDNFTFNGIVKIITKVQENTTEVILHIDNITCQVVTLQSNGNNVPIVNITHDKKHQFLRITTAETIVSSSTLLIKIKYIGYLSTDKRGFYRNFYIDDVNQKKWFAVTHLEPIGARKMFPCFDEPAFRATFQLNVSRTADFKAISSTKLTSTVTENDRYLDIFERSSVMPTYSVDLILTNFSSVNEAFNHFFWTVENKTHDTLHYNLNKEHFNYEYIEFLQLKSQLENWGLIAYKNDTIITNSDYVSVSDKLALKSKMVYEIAHWLFGRNVSPHWWKDVWLSTGFSKFIFIKMYTMKSDTNVYGHALFVINELQPSLVVSALPSSHPISYDVYTPTQILDIFDSISGDKGASILRMIGMDIEWPVFFKGLNVYYLRKQNKSAKPDDLYSSLQTVIKDNSYMKLNTSVKTIMDSWITQPGFPVIQVKIDNGIATLSQKRFLSKNSDESPVHKIWWVPITWTSSVEANFTETETKYWLSKAVDTITVDKVDDNGWIIFNIQAFGYYRVNYDSKSWSRIIKALKSKDFEKIHEINRASILDDLFNLAKAGYVDYSIALSASQYLVQETNYIPWKSVFDHFDYLDVKIVDKSILYLLKSHIGKIIEPIYKKLGFEERQDEGYYDLLLRPKVLEWICKYSHQDCVEKSIKMFDDWKSNSSKLVPINIRSVVYCAAVKHGALSNWQFLWNKYQETNYQTEKTIIIKALGCSKVHNKLNQLLSYAVDKTSGMTPQDSVTAFASVYSTGFQGVKVVMDHFSNQYIDIHNYFNDFNQIKSIIKDLSFYLITEDLVSQLEGFIAMYSRKLAPIKEVLTSYVAEARDELKWQDTYIAKIFEFLSSQYSFIDYHLPKHIYPINYKIRLIPNLEDGVTFNGTVEITMNVIKPTSSIILNASKLTILDIKVVYTNTNKSLEVSSYRFDIYRKLIIHLNTTISTGSKLTMFIKYSGDMITRKGFYQSSYKDEAGIEHWLTATQFRKYGASEAFPCFDDPSFTAKFQLSIRRPNDYHTISNMKLLNSTFSTSSNGIWDNFEESEVMSSHNLVFMVIDFESNLNLDISDNVTDSNVTQFSTNALEVGQKTLDFLEKHTGVPNPVGKVNLNIIPDFAVDTPEHWNLITFKESEMLHFNKYNIPIDLIRDVDIALVNKLANIWLSKLITPEWWSYFWLTEGFAQYFQWFITDSLRPEWGLMEQFIVDELQPALLKDSFINVSSVNARVLYPYDGKKYDYGKAVGIIHMMKYMYGEELVQEALKDYLKENRNKVVKPSNLWSAIQTLKTRRREVRKIPKELITVLMNSWTNQAGYPVVHASLIGKTLMLRQERFLITGRNSSYDEIYWIPITIASKWNSDFSNTSPALWLEGKRGIVTDSLNVTDDGWFILNVQQTGFYRVNYDLHSWNNLIKTLKNVDGFGGISEINKAQIIDDILNLARADYIPYGLALNGTEYLSKEKSYLPWKAFFNAVSFLYDRLDGQNVGKAFKEYLLKLIKPIYEEIGVEERVDDRQMDKLNRQLILSWTCKLDYPDCINTSKKLFNEWRENTTVFISPDVKQNVFCTAVKYGNYDDWQFLWGKYLESRLESEKIILLNALGCSQNGTIIDEYFNSAISRNGSISEQYVTTVFASVYSAGKYGVDATLMFLVNNYHYLCTYFNNSDPVAELFSNVIAKISTSNQLSDLVVFTSVNKKESIQKSIKFAEENLKWYNNHNADIEDWLLSKGIVTNSSKNYERNIKNSEYNNSILIIFVQSAVIIFLIVAMIAMYFCLKGQNNFTL